MSTRLTREQYNALNKRGVFARQKARSGKFNAQRTPLDGIKFASKKEARRGAELMLLQKAGKISDLTFHPRYYLGVAGKVIGEAVFDASYYTVGEFLKVVEDVKTQATNTALSKWKRKHFEAQYGLKVRLI